MGLFECCHYCVAPKRHLGCHDTCPEYLEDKQICEERKELERLIKSGTPQKSPAHVRAIREKYRNQHR